MVVSEFFDTVCRCFGSVPSHPSGAGRRSPNRSDVETVDKTTEIRRRTSCVELQDREWDSLFSEPAVSKMGSPARQKSISQNKSSASNSMVDLEYAQALAKAKIAANPSCRRRHAPQGTAPATRRQGSKHRKSPAARRNDIFRSRPYDSSSSRGNSGGKPSPNSFSRFLSTHQGVANALCFATPIREDNDGGIDDASDTHTLNTCEDDTVTSTLYFDSKLSHMVEKQPPMPLFHQFKVNEQDTDQLRRIVATDSHSSLKMVRLLQGVKDSNIKLDDSSSSEEEPETCGAPPRTGSPELMELEDDDIVPDSMKINSSSSSKSSSVRTPSSRHFSEKTQRYVSASRRSSS